MKRTWTVLSILSVALLCLSNLQVQSQELRPQSAGRTRSDTEKPSSRLVQQAKDEGRQFPVVELFQDRAPSIFEMAAVRPAEMAPVETGLNDGVVLSLNEDQTSQVIENDVEAITLPLTAPNRATTELELVRVDIHTPDFTVVTSESDGTPVDYEKGVHYRGVVRGEMQSVAAISVFPDEVMGFYSTEAEGNFIFGRMGGENRENHHILYAEKDLKAESPFYCGTKDDAGVIPSSGIQELQALPVANSHVRIYIEADFDLFVNKGNNVGNVAAFVSGFFNQAAAIYSNEGIPIVFSQLFVWTTPSPYTGTDSVTLLSQFQSFRNAFNGDLGHLINLKNVGGVAAGFDGFCNSNLDARQCFSGIFNFYNNVPTYSWTINVFTHEMGHLMGSRHTHACVWNGNNTAIDGCAGATEGGCPLPGFPPGGGTIMSYCHLRGVGINLANGFGPQPGNVIRSRFAGASCLTQGVPLYRYYSLGALDHLYTIDYSEIGAGKGGYVLEFIQCRIHRTQLPGTVPLYRYYHAGIWDHLYTTNFAELGNGKGGYVFERIEGFVYSSQVPGSVPLYRYWSPGATDHFYTTFFSELGNGAGGYFLEGNAGFVLP